MQWRCCLARNHCPWNRSPSSYSATLTICRAMMSERAVHSDLKTVVEWGLFGAASWAIRQPRWFAIATSPTSCLTFQWQYPCPNSKGTDFAHANLLTSTLSPSPQSCASNRSWWLTWDRYFSWECSKFDWLDLHNLTCSNFHPNICLRATNRQPITKRQIKEAQKFKLVKELQITNKIWFKANKIAFGY